MIASSVKGKLFLVAVFVIGMAAGALVFNIYETRLSADSEPSNRTQRAQRDVKAFHDYLGLKPEQREQVRKIMEERAADFRRLSDQTRPQYDAIRQEARERVRALMNDEQKRKYDEFLKKMRERGQRASRPNNSSPK